MPITDHTNRTPRLSPRRWLLPITLAPDEQLTIIALNTLDGAAFDVAYIRE